MEQAAEQQGWVQGVEPLAITSITATAGGLETWMERWRDGWGCEVISYLRPEDVYDKNMMSSKKVK